jgi:hypothetical protein
MQSSGEAELILCGMVQLNVADGVVVGNHYTTSLELPLYGVTNWEVQLMLTCAGS